MSRSKASNTGLVISSVKLIARTASVGCMFKISLPAMSRTVSVRSLRYDVSSLTKRFSILLISFKSPAGMYTVIDLPLELLV